MATRPGSRKERREREPLTRNDVIVRTSKYEHVSSVLNTLIPSAAAVLIAWFFYLSVAKLAGQQTDARIGFGILLNEHAATALAWLFGGGGVGYGLRQRKLARDIIEKHHPQKKQEELQVDPNRSSSTLTPRGETRPGD